MVWTLIAAMISSGLAAIALWVSYLQSKSKPKKRQHLGYEREEIQIDAANVPEFKPTWRDAR